MKKKLLFYLIVAAIVVLGLSACHTEAPVEPKAAVDKDTHSLMRERVNGVVMNTDDWYELFSIQPNDKLYCKEEDRVRIW